MNSLCCRRDYFLLQRYIIILKYCSFKYIILLQNCIFIKLQLNTL